jgi:hypothetical protein
LTAEGAVTAGLHYRAQWDDAFGARGWKLDGTETDPEVIAATPYPGEVIPTSVLIHDLLDHRLCGLTLSDYGDEAMALVQLARRTGSDPTPDYARMVDDDLLNGLAGAATLRRLLPEGAAEAIVDDPPPREAVARLREVLGPGLLRTLLLAGFARIGWSGDAAARAAFRSNTGLDPERRPALGRALQAAFAAADEHVLQQGWEAARGHFEIAADEVALTLETPEAVRFPAALPA